MAIIEKNVNLKKEFGELIKTLGIDVTRYHVVPELLEERQKYAALMEQKLYEIRQSIHDKQDQSLMQLNSSTEDLNDKLNKYSCSIQSLEAMVQRFNSATHDFMYKSDIAARSKELVDVINNIKNELSKFVVDRSELKDLIRLQNENYVSLFEHFDTQFKAIDANHTETKRSIMKSDELLYKNVQSHDEQMTKYFNKIDDNSKLISKLVLENLTSLKNNIDQSESSVVSKIEVIEKLLQGLVEGQKVGHDYMEIYFYEILECIELNKKKQNRLFMLSFFICQLTLVGLAALLYLFLI